jgi:hypothetical protein
VASVGSHGANLNRDIAQRNFAATMRQLGGGVSRPLQGSEVDRTRGQTRHEDLRRADLHAQFGFLLESRKCGGVRGYGAEDSNQAWRLQNDRLFPVEK